MLGLNLESLSLLNAVANAPVPQLSDFYLVLVVLHLQVESTKNFRQRTLALHRPSIINCPRASWPACLQRPP